jgi:hypothetical protein
VFQALALLDQALTATDGTATWSLTDTQLRQAVAGTHQRLQALQARIDPPTAGRDVRAAKALDPDGDLLPGLGTAFAAGEVSRHHVDVAVAARNNIPKRLLTPVDENGVSGAQKVDQELTSHARTYCPKTAQGLAGYLLAVLDPTGQNRFDPDAPPGAPSPARRTPPEW